MLLMARCTRCTHFVDASTNHGLLKRRATPLLTGGLLTRNPVLPTRPCSLGKVRRRCQRCVYFHKSAASPQLNPFSTAADPTLDVSASKKRADWDAFVVSINKALNCLDLEFRHVMDESTGLEMYAIVCGKNTGPHIIGG